MLASAPSALASASLPAGAAQPACTQARRPQAHSARISCASRRQRTQAGQAASSHADCTTAPAGQHTFDVRRGHRLLRRGRFSAGVRVSAGQGSSARAPPTAAPSKTVRGLQTGSVDPAPAASMGTCPGLQTCAGAGQSSMASWTGCCCQQLCKASCNGPTAAGSTSHSRGRAHRAATCLSMGLQVQHRQAHLVRPATVEPEA